MVFSGPVRQLFYSTFLIIFVVTIGMLGFHWIEGLSLLDSLYMAIITVSTVGYETIGELSSEGKVFVIFLISFTLGTFLYAISSLTTLLVEGEIRRIYFRYKVNKSISKLNDHIILCGLGRNGREAAMELLEKKESFVVIEENLEIIDNFRSSHEFLALEGDATNEEVMLRANIKSARGVITTLPDDASNVFVALTARELNPKTLIVARASNESTISKLHRAGADKVVIPNLLGGRKMAKIITTPALVEFVEMISGEGETNLRLEEVKCTQYGNLIGLTIKDLKIREKSGALVLGYRDQHGKFRLNPPPQKTFEKNEIVFILGTHDQIEAFRTHFLD